MTTRYIVEAHWRDGSRQLFGDPPFIDAWTGVQFGEALKGEYPNELLDYAVIPLTRSSRLFNHVIDLRPTEFGKRQPNIS